MRDIVTIMADDLIAVDRIRDTFGVHVSTPNMDRLAAQGITFSNAFATTAICSPSRAATLSGTAPWTNGVHSNEDNWIDRIDPAQMLPNLLRAQGYQAHGFGKSFHGLSSGDAPLFFDSFVEHYRKPYVVETSMTRSPDALNVRDATDFLAAYDSADPLLMLVGLGDTHGPHISPRQFLDLYPRNQLTIPNWPTPQSVPDFVRGFMNTDVLERLGPEGLKLFVQRYLANISEMDHRLGELLDAIEASGRDPAIVFTSDHGYHLGDRDTLHKFTPWDGAGRAPVIIVESAFGSSARGEVYNGVVSLLDIAPTILELAGLRPAQHHQGRSLADLFEGGSLSPGVALTTMFGSVSLRTDNWRYVRYEDGSQELFQVHSDPTNSYNLAGQERHDDILERMDARLRVELAKVDVTIDDIRQTIVHNRGAGEFLYFVTEASDLSTLVDLGGIDSVYASQTTFSLPGWLENFSASGPDDALKAPHLIHGNARDNVIITSHGDDRIIAYAGDDSLDGFRGDDHLQAGGGRDLLFGNHGDDALIAQSGHDTLQGGLGNDTLSGMEGNDLMTGGDGRDTFDYNALAELGLTEVTRDVITDFNAGTNVSTIDQIDVSTIDANTGLAGNQAFVFGGAFTAGHIRAVQAGPNVILQLNTDADAAAEMTLQLNGVLAGNLTRDFVL